MSKLSLAELKALIAEYVDETHIGHTGFVESRNNLAELIDKIGKIVTIDNSFSDRLPEFDGKELPLGKTVEEWYQDLVLPTEYDENGSKTMDPAYPTYRPAAYSESLGRRQFKTTVKYNSYERACNSSDEAEALVNMVTKRLFDSFALWKFGVKKEMLGKLADRAVTAQETAGTWAVGTTYEVGTYIEGAVVVKKYNGAGADSLDEAVKQGYAVKLNIAQKMDNPTTAAEGEAQIKACKKFIKQVKADVEAGSFATEGFSLNGNTIGSEEGLLLIVSKGLMPLIEVEIEAGAFQLDKLALPATIKVVDDFGASKTGVFAMLIDPRGIRLHNDYQAIREQMNADGDFMNYVLHTENTAFISRNTFVKIYK